MWRLTQKRRENLARLCLNILTVDIAGLVIPFLLRAYPFDGILFASAWGAAFFLGTLMYLLEP